MHDFGLAQGFVKLVDPATGRTMNIDSHHDERFSRLVRSFTVRLSKGGHGTIELQTALPLELGYEFIEAGMTQAGMHLGVNFGWEKLMSGWIFGSVFDPPNVEVGETVAVTYNATCGGTTDLFRGSSTEWGGKTYEQIVRSILALHGFEGERLEITGDLSRTYYADSLPQGGRTDIQFIRQLGRYAGFEFSIVGNKARVWTRASRGQPVAKFVFRRQINPSMGIFPLTSFSTPDTHMWLSTAAHGVRSADIDADSKEHRDTAVDATDASGETSGSKEALEVGATPEAAESGTGGAQAPDTETGTFAQAVVPRRGHNEGQVKDLLEARMSAERSMGAINLELECPIGKPDLLPGHLIEAEVGLSVIDGIYDVHEVTHSWAGSYSMMLTCLMETLPDGHGAKPDTTQPLNLNTMVETDQTSGMLA